MIITQKFHSVKEIDEEFIPTLEELLGSQVPSFDWIRKFESEAPSDVHFTYYLFFGNKHNAPIGYAQLMLKPDETKNKNWFSKFFNKKPNVPTTFKRAVWNLPNECEGIVFEPRYIKAGMLKAQEIFNEYQSRQDIQTQVIQLADHHNVEENQKALHESHTAQIYLKSCDSYQEYINQLSKKQRQHVQNLWKEGNKEFCIGEYSSYKQMFQYKNLAELYRLLKKHPLISRYYNLKNPTHYLTLEENGDIYAIAVLTSGKKDYSFYDIIVLQEGVNTELLHQMAIMKFYDLPMTNRLVWTTPDQSARSLHDFGFMEKRTLTLTYKKAS
jgi:hypothetical protein